MAFNWQLKNSDNSNISDAMLLILKIPHSNLQNIQKYLLNLGHHRQERKFDINENVRKFSNNPNQTH